VKSVYILQLHLSPLQPLIKQNRGNHSNCIIVNIPSTISLVSSVIKIYKSHQYSQ